jgi:hypothetical protein
MVVGLECWGGRSLGDGYFSHVFVGIDCDNIGSSGFTSIGELGSKCNANGGWVWFIWGTLINIGRGYINISICEGKRSIEEDEFRGYG